MCLNDEKVYDITKAVGRSSFVYAINDAINYKKKTSFRYFEYGARKQQKLKKTERIT